MRNAMACFLMGAVMMTSTMASGASTDTEVLWERGEGGSVTVTASREGRRLAEAQVVIQSVADRLDALRTIKQHVQWRRIAWRDGLLEIEAWAESALYGNLTIVSVRDLLPGRGIAGSGVRPTRSRHREFRWFVKILLTAPNSRDDK